MIGNNSSSGVLGAPIGMPDANGNLVGDPIGAGVIDAMLGPLGNFGGPTETHLPLPGSPVFDAGDPAFAPPPDRDQRGFGFARVMDFDLDGNAVIDIGAVELNQILFNGSFEPMAPPGP